MAINAGKVVVGGLAAGVVANVIDSVANGVVLFRQNETPLRAINPALVDDMMRVSTIAGYVVIDLIFGLLLVWTHAAMHPRLPGGIVRREHE